MISASTRGVSAYTRPAPTAGQNADTPRARVTQYIPRNAATNNADSHNRWVAHGGTSSHRANDEERPHREQVAVGLVLQSSALTERIPHRHRLAQEPRRVDDEVELRVGSGASGVLGDHYQCQGQRDGEQAEPLDRSLGSRHRRDAIASKLDEQTPPRLPRVMGHRYTAGAWLPPAHRTLDAACRCAHRCLQRRVDVVVRARSTAGAISTHRRPDPGVRRCQRGRHARGRA